MNSILLKATWRSLELALQILHFVYLMSDHRIV